MRIQLSSKEHDSGAVAIVVALLAVVLIGLAAFAIDFGMAYSQRRALSTGADSAALAIVRQNYDKVIKDPSLTCSQLITAGETAAQSTALTQVNSNKPFGATLPASSIQTPVLSCVGAQSGILQATVTVSKTVDTYFGKIFGVSTLPISRSAAAALGAVNEVSGYLPIALCKNQADEILANAKADANASPPVVGRHELILLDKKWKGSDPCNLFGVAEGNWGWLYCDKGGSNDLADTIENGCPEPLVIKPGTPPSVEIKGTPGNKNSSQISSAMKKLMDKSVAIPVYDEFVCDKPNCAGGANTTYRVIGFLSVKLCGYRDNNSTESGTCYKVGDETIGLEAPRNVTLVDNSLQVQNATFTPVADLSELCNLGQTCTFNAFVTPLIK